MSDNQNISLTVEAWAKIVIERWELQMARAGVRGTGKLLNSFMYTIHSQANGNPELIQFAFNYYGKFVDMGVGRGVTLESVGVSNRKPKPWYSKVFWSQFQKLKELMVEKYKIKSTMSIITEIEKNDL
jgi:hypothetical protein